MTLPGGPGHAGDGQDSRHGVDTDARVEGLGTAALATDGEVHRGIAGGGQDGHGVLAHRQRLEVRGLQVDLGAAVVLNGVIALGKGLAVHLHALEGAESRGGTEHQSVVAGGVICGGLIGAVQHGRNAGVEG